MKKLLLAIVLIVGCEEPEPVCSAQLSNCNSLDDFDYCLNSDQTISTESLCCTGTIKNKGDLRLNTYRMWLDVEYIDFTFDHSSHENWLVNHIIPVDSSITLEARFSMLFDLNGDMDRITSFEVGYNLECLD